MGAAALAPKLSRVRVVVTRDRRAARGHARQSGVGEGCLGGTAPARSRVPHRGRDVPGKTSFLEEHQAVRRGVRGGDGPGAERPGAATAAGTEVADAAARRDLHRPPDRVRRGGSLPGAEERSSVGEQGRKDRGHHDRDRRLVRHEVSASRSPPKSHPSVADERAGFTATAAIGAGFPIALFISLMTSSIKSRHTTLLPLPLRAEPLVASSGGGLSFRGSF